MGKIESLIGKIRPHLSEVAKARESFDIAVKNYDQMRNDQAESDVLEQINIACDIELLSDYLKELNALSPEPFQQNEKKQAVPDKQPRPIKDGTRNAIEIPADVIPSIVDVIGKKTTRISKKYLIAAMFLGLFAVIGFIFLLDKPEHGPEKGPSRQIDNSIPASNAGTGDTMRTSTEQPESTDGNQPEQQIADDGEEPVLSLNLLSESRDPNHPSGEYSGEEKMVSDQTIDHYPPPVALDDENALQPIESEPQAIGSETAESELINKLISDMQTKYDSSPATTTVPKKDLEQTYTEKEELKAVADVTASLALVQNAKKGVPDNTGSSSNSQKNTSKRASGSEKPSEIKNPSKAAAKTLPDQKPSLETSSPTKASSKKVEKDGVKKSQSKPSEKQLAAVSKEPKTNTTKSAKPSGASKEQSTAASPGKEKAQPKQALKDKPEQPQSRQQKPGPVKKPEPQKPKATEPTSPTKKLASIDPAALDWARKSRESFQKGDMSETIVSATVSISIEPGQVQPYIDRALAYKQKGLFEKAIADCNRAMVNDPGSAIAVYTRGVVYQSMGQKQNARIDYAKACVMGFVDACDIQTAQLEKDSVDQLMKQSRESFRKGDWDAVVLATTDVLKQDPANVTAYVTRSAAYSQKKMFTAAISDCDAALKIDPGYALAYNNRGYAWEQLEKTETAMKDYKQACSLGLKLGCKNFEKF